METADEENSGEVPRLSEDFYQGRPDRDIEGEFWDAYEAEMREHLTATSPWAKLRRATKPSPRPSRLRRMRMTTTALVMCISGGIAIGLALYSLMAGDRLIVAMAGLIGFLSLGILVQEVRR